MNIKSFIILLIVFSSELFSQEHNIIWNEIPTDTLVNMGPCFVDDSLETSFTFFNNSELPAYVDYVSPTIIIQRGLNQQIVQEFRQFEQLTVPQAGAVEIAANSNLNILVSYNPDRLSIAPLGWQEAHLDLAMTSDPQLSDILVSKRFRLRAKKTRLFLDSFEDTLRFDSVYVNPTSYKESSIRLKSTWRDNIRVESQNVDYLSPITSDPEFEIDLFDVNPEFPKKYQIVNWPVRYYPVNRGLDSAFFEVIFKPLPNQFPDSSDKVPVWVSGIGVEQELSLTNSNYDISGDTIKLGNIRVDIENEIFGSISNTGNIPFGFEDELFFDVTTLQETNIIQSTNSLSDKNDLPPNGNASFTLSIKPEEIGYFIYEYRIRSDITERNIHGVPASENYKSIFIEGNATLPRLTLPSDSINLGSIVLNTVECSSIRDTLIEISNSGNEQLVIRSIDVEPPFPASQFNVFPKSMVIPPDSDTNIRITFQSSADNIGNHNAKVVFNLNVDPPNDQKELFLSATGLPPVKAEISIPNDLKAKPGTVVSMPILLRNGSSSPSVFGRSFSGEIRYDSTLLVYRNRLSLNTAFEGAGIIIDESPGNLSISAVNESFFASSDTLIILEFDSFLGFRPATEITFNDIFISDGDCPQILNLTISNGEFRTDSVCALDEIAIPVPFADFEFNLISNNPVENNISFEIDLPRNATIEVSIYDVFGNQAGRKIQKNFDEGKHELYIDLKNLSQGNYFVVCREGFNIKSIPFSIVK
jgi:hypothetical protein